MKKILSFFLILILIAACGGGLYYYFEMRDTTPPAIVVSRQPGVLYHAGISSAELLQGVVAIDDKSGNVSDTLVVASVSQGAAPDTATVIYSAQDKAGHVTQLAYEMQTDGSPVEGFINNAAVPETPVQQNAGTVREKHPREKCPRQQMPVPAVRLRRQAANGRRRFRWMVPASPQRRHRPRRLRRHRMFRHSP